MGKIIGIDLGTTNSCAAYFENGKIIVIPNSFGNRVTPSIVAFNEKNVVLVGEEAKNQSLINSIGVVTNVKRKMGTKEEISVAGKKYFPETISSYILSKIKKDAEKFLNEKVNDAVITVPAYFTESQRQAAIDAGTLAGLNVVRIINEPTAASLSYGLNLNESQNVLVYDLGGGTYDISVLELEDGVFEVKSTKGNNKLGGMDFDKRLADLIVDKFFEETGIDLSKDKLAYRKIFEEAEKAKKLLSDIDEIEINIPFITADKNGPKHLELNVTREQFETLIEDYIDETISLMDEAIKEAGLTKDQIDEAILVGGSSRIPFITKKIEDYIGKKVFKGVNPDEVVASGAAIQGAILKGEIRGVALVDVIPISLGIEIDKGLFVPIITRNSPIPTEARKLFTTISDDQDEVEIHILQGENRLAKDNSSLGKFTLSGIRKAEKGVPRIEVCFDINADSILNVTAVDLDTKESHKIIVTSKVNLTKDEMSDILNDKSVIKGDNIDALKVRAKELIGNIQKISKKYELEKKFTEEIDFAIMETNRAIDEKNSELLEKNTAVLRNFYLELVENDENVDDLIQEDNFVLN